MSAALILTLLLFSLNGNANTDKYRISGPYEKNNLSVYLIHGQDKIKNQNYLTLGEALQKNKVKVYETGNVNQLSIENISTSDHIYIQAGDIVKGGKQDRVFSTDMVLQPGSGKVDIASFCVEQGRWQKRGKESSKVFHSSTKKLSSKNLRIAARLKNSQTEVWDEVDKEQQKLGKSIGQDIKSKDSSTSLQLALENKKLAENVTEYKKALLPLLQDKKNVIGYAFAINGELNTADIYANQALFRKLWPTILDSISIESVAEYNKALNYAIPNKETVSQWMDKTNNGNISTRNLNASLKQDTIENATDVRFDTYSGTGSDKKLFRQNIIKK
jgi:hypothetical protein